MTWLSVVIKILFSLILISENFIYYDTPIFLSSTYPRNDVSKRLVGGFASNSRRKDNVCSTKSERNKVAHSSCQMDSHADTIVTGKNCCILSYTGKICDVAPFNESYDSLKNVPVVSAATTWQCNDDGQVYILVFNEALWMGDSMEHTLVNPNQLRHCGTIVKDDPTDETPIHIRDDNGTVFIPLKMKGTIAGFKSHTPTQYELENFPHIHLSSTTPWEPDTVTFVNNHARSMEEEITHIRAKQISDVSTSNCKFNVGSIPLCIIASIKTNPPPTKETKTATASIENQANNLIRNHNIEVGDSEQLFPSTFETTKRHTDVTPLDLSERWNISLHQASKTLKNTTQRFKRSILLPLSRRYWSDRMFDRKTLSGTWATDTIDGRCVSLDGNKYAQLFANKGYFAKIYPMDRKGEAGAALRVFCQEYGVPMHLISDGSKEQTKKNTQFQKQVR